MSFDDFPFGLGDLFFDILDRLKKGKFWRNLILAILLIIIFILIILSILI